MDRKGLLARRKLLKLALSGGTGFSLALLGEKLALARSDRSSSRFTKQEFDSDLPEPPRGAILETSEFEVVTVDEEGKEIDRDTLEARYFNEGLGRDVSLAMVAIPGGTFTMGASQRESNITRERPQREVEVAPFFMSRFPITQAQWAEVSRLPSARRDLSPNPSTFIGDNLPVEGISWGDCIEFCRRLSRETRRKYRLPSEAEWEYACRAGTETPFYFGETITSDLANYRGDRVYAREEPGEFRDTTTEVGIFPPNAFGLYDMHGNVWEWCEDMWHPNYFNARRDAKARTPETDRGLDDSRSLLRGGSWRSAPIRCRSAYRSRDERDSRAEIFGLRVVCETEEG